jgi:hypothetical protein
MLQVTLKVRLHVVHCSSASSLRSLFVKTRPKAEPKNLPTAASPQGQGFNIVFRNKYLKIF